MMMHDKSVDEHLVESLRLIWDLYFIFQQLESINNTLVDLDSCIEVECDWGHWASRCAEILEFKIPFQVVN